MKKMYNIFIKLISFIIIICLILGLFNILNIFCLSKEAQLSLLSLFVMGLIYLNQYNIQYKQYKLEQIKRLIRISECIRVAKQKVEGSLKSTPYGLSTDLLHYEAEFNSYFLKEKGFTDIKKMYDSGTNKEEIMDALYELDILVQNEIKKINNKIEKKNQWL